MAIQKINLGTEPLGEGGDTYRSANTKINENFSNTAHAASRLVGEADGNVLQKGAFGLGTYSIKNQTELASAPLNTGIYKYSASEATLLVNWDGGYCWGINFAYAEAYVMLWHSSNGDKARYKIYHEGNTTKDSNGFLKGKSPVTRLFSDRLEHQGNDKELKQIEFEKLGVGDYLLKNTTGLANEGWYIETPKDANGNVLVAVVYEQLENNDISVKTYDYILNKKGRIVPDVDTPLDIPETRWIDLRFNEFTSETESK